MGLGGPGVVRNKAFNEYTFGVAARAYADLLASPAFREALAAAKVKAGGEDSPVNDRDLEFSDAIIRELTNGGD